MSDQTYIIVGASLAGAKAAEELREHGFDGRVVLVGAESERPYERPPLSKDYLRGESEREKAYVHPAILDAYKAGELPIDGVDGATRTARCAKASEEYGLDEDERIVLSNLTGDETPQPRKAPMARRQQTRK